MHAREMRAWKERAEDADKRERFCFKCLQNNVETPNRKTALHYKHEGDQSPCNSACYECQHRAFRCLECGSAGGTFRYR